MKIIATCFAAAALSLSGAVSATVISSTPTTFTTDQVEAAVYELDTSYDGDVLVDFTLSHTGTLANNSYVGLWFGQSTGPSLGLKANCGNGSCSNDVYVRTNGTGGAYAPGSNLAKDKLYHIIGHLQKKADGRFYNQFDLWFFTSVQPVNLASLGPAHASYTRGTSQLESFDTIGFRTLNIAAPGRSVTVDDVRINEVPEPGSVALMGLAMAGLAFARRRKQA